MRKSHASLLIKATVSGLLLFWSFHLVHFELVAARIARLNSIWLSIAILLLLTQIYVQAVRWRILLAQCGAEAQIGDLFRFSMIGAFFNQTLPSSIGGDGMKFG